VRLALHVVRERKRLSGAWVIDLDVGAFAPAACRVHELGRAGAAFLGEIPDSKLLASRLEDRVLGVRVLAEQSLEARARPQRAIRILAAGGRTGGGGLGGEANRG